MPFLCYNIGIENLRRSNGKLKKSKAHRRSRLAALIAVLILLCAVSALYIVKTSTQRNVEHNIDVAETVEPAADTLAEDYSDAADKTISAMAAEHVYSHRGASGDETENTEAAFDKAIAEGSRNLEFGVVISADGTLYVSNEFNVWPMTGTVAQFNALHDDDIDKLRTHDGKKILKLSEVFDKYSDTVNYLIELKDANDACIKAFRTIVDKYGYTERIIVESSYPSVLEKVEKIYPDMQKLHIIRSGPEFRSGLKKEFVDIVAVRDDLMSADWCKDAHDAGKKFSIWTLNEEDDIRRAIEMGADSYSTDYTGAALGYEARYRFKFKRISAGPSTLFFASDYQSEKGWPSPADNLKSVVEAACADGKKPQEFIICGDYSNDRKLHDYQISPEDTISEIRDTVISIVPDIGSDNFVFVQGNHDKMTESIADSGLHEYGKYLVYVLNTENDFPWKQGKVSGSLDKVQHTADEFSKCMKELIDNGETRPVIIAGHVPLHFTARTSSKHSTGDNLYSGILFDAVNEAGKSLDIIYLFGHNHTKGWDCYMGGSCVFATPGDSILIPDYSEGDTVTDTFTQEELNFTYMNAGYVGHYMNCSPKEVENGTVDKYNAADQTLTGTVCEIYPDRIVMTRYSTDGIHDMNGQGEGDPYLDHLDASLISDEYYRGKVSSPQTIKRFHIGDETELKEAA